MRFIGFSKSYKRFLAVFMSVAMVMTLISFNVVKAEENNDLYPYTIFSSSTDDGAITINAGNICINGNVATNGTIVSDGSLNINGSCKEKAEEEMIYIFEKIDASYFLNDIDEHVEDYILEETNINVDLPTLVEGETILTGNININTALKSFDNISLYGEVKNTDESVIFSKYGNIVIDSENVNLNGLVYAPFGHIYITAQNLNLNNVVIIAQSVVIECPNVNVNYSNNAAKLVGNKSELLYIPPEEWQYMEDSDGDGLPDYFADYSNWSNMLDTDGEGLPDSIEDFISTDKNNIDTDFDGLNDFYEIFGTLTDPTLYDTDENGTNDGDEDYDNDGLSNIQEYNQSTKPHNGDTDDDGLNDGDEVNMYKTDPLIQDSDNDKLDDGDEVVLGTNPSDPDTDKDGILDGDEKFPQTFSFDNGESIIESVTISMEATGNIQKTTSVENIMDTDVICSGVVGLVGEPFSIETESDFDNAIVSFKIDESKLGETEFSDLLFLWYDEANYEFVELETIYNEANSTVSIETTHFSRYMIVDKYKWFEAWAVTFNYNPGANNNLFRDVVYNSVLAIDCSGSMKSIDPITTRTNINSADDALYRKTCERIKAAEGFIYNMNEADKAAIVFFTSSASIAASMTTNDSNILRLALQDVTSYGGTSFNAAISKSISAFGDEDFEDGNAVNRIILLSDGDSTVSDSYLDKAVEKNIKIYTIGLGSGSNDTVLEYIAEYTGGEFYKAFTSDELVDIYKEVGIDSDFDTTDTDEDGLYDAVEAAGIRIQNGSVITGCDPTTEDTDRDGLDDGVEIDPVIRSKVIYYSSGSSYGTGKEYYFFMYSNPCDNGDTDGDGLLDAGALYYNNKAIAPKDPDPVNYTGSEGMWNTHISEIKNGINTSYTYSSDYYTPPKLEGEIKYWGIFPYWDNNSIEILVSALTSIGSIGLDFRYDNEHIALHSDTTQWQSIGGYNDFYDWVFDFVTDMNRLKLDFTSNHKNYVVWAWKGNYLNLGAGSEVGFYTQNGTLEDMEENFHLEQWMVSDTLPMTLSLYKVLPSSRTIISNYYHWLPYDEQWWITGFVPDIYGYSITGDGIKAEELLTIASVDFSKNPAMLQDLMNVWEKEDASESLIFDEEDNKLWIVW